MARACHWAALDWCRATEQFYDFFLRNLQPHTIQLDRVEVVLVSPRNPLNIGAAARAMANFGFRRLAVVAPYAPNWREARSAVGAPELLQGARETTTLPEALAQCTLVVGTAAFARRTPEQRAVPLSALAPLVGGEIARGGRVAIVFGSEKRGLTREDLSYCHLLVQIPTDPGQPSMNLGQAVAVCLYEMASRLTIPTTEDGASPGLENQETWGTGGQAHNRGQVAPAEMLDRLAEVIEQTMIEADYSPRTMQASNRLDLRLMLRRVKLNNMDARRVLGVFRRILWRLRNPIR